jgi:hypothetical protein
LSALNPDWRTQLLAVITRAHVAYGLMLIGIYGLLLEGYNPGVMLPGVIGHHLPDARAVRLPDSVGELCRAWHWWPWVWA